MYFIIKRKIRNKQKALIKIVYLNSQSKNEQSFHFMFVLFLGLLCVRAVNFPAEKTQGDIDNLPSTPQYQ